MSKAKTETKRSIETIKVTEPPKIPMGFGKKPSMFSGGTGSTPRGQFVPQTVRITQNKGGGGK